jgi:hypothetical protein
MGVLFQGEPVLENQFDLSHWVGHVTSIIAALGAFMGLLPSAVALVALIWYSVQLYESRTVQHYLRNRKMVRKAKKIARLRAKEKVIIAELEALEVMREAKATAREKVAKASHEAEVLVVHETADQKINLPPV